VLAIVAGLLACMPAARGNDTGASYGAVDPARVRCDVLMRMHDRAARGTEQQFYTWTLGYFAGRMAESPNSTLQPLPVSGSERRRVYIRLLDFCRDNPAATFGLAVDNLVRSSMAAEEH
jgi:hypothetical protein